ncbi:MAG: spermine synthase [Microbacterium sp.]|nr:MAG: spermine synthase [Microbacterium sp.]
MPIRRRVFSLMLGDREAVLLRSRLRPGRYELRVDGVPQSIVSASDPTALVYSYARRIARAIDAAAPAGAPLFAVHLGAGALTLPRYVEATRPGSRQLVVEFEPELYAAVLAALPLPPHADVRAVFGDARDVADSREATLWTGAQFTVVDLWDAAVIRHRVASREFYARITDRATPGGVVAVNLLDGHPFEYSRRQAATLRSVFEHVAVTLDFDPDDEEGPLGNVLVFASNRPLAIAQRPALLGPPAAHLFTGDELAAWIGAARIMTDADGTDSPDPDDPRWN